MKRIITPTATGVEVTTPAIPDQINDVLLRCGPGSYIVDDVDLPKDRSSRDAWIVGNGVVNVDAVKAAAIQAAHSSVAKA